MHQINQCFAEGNFINIISGSTFFVANSIKPPYLNCVEHVILHTHKSHIYLPSIRPTPVSSLLFELLSLRDDTAERKRLSGIEEREVAIEPADIETEAFGMVNTEETGDWVLFPDNITS